MLFINTSYESPRWSFNLTIKNYFQKGTFHSKGFPYDSVFTDYKDGGTMPTPSNLYNTNEEHYLIFEIIIAQNKQYSGTFSGEMVNEEGKVIKITEGRFDIKKNNP